LCSSACIPFDQAQRHIGETQCATGKVLRVETGAKGVHYLDFCEDYRLCPFAVVVFSYDLKNVGDVRELAGKVVEIHGEVKEYDDRAEIILESRKQLGGDAASLAVLGTQRSKSLGHEDQKRLTQRARSSQRTQSL
jgi:hypothetical protein